MFHLVFSSTPQNIKDWEKKGIFEVGNSFPYEGAHLVKSSNLALLGILVQLVQKLNQNVSVKHPISAKAAGCRLSTTRLKK